MWGVSHLWYLKKAFLSNVKVLLNVKLIDFYCRRLKRLIRQVYVATLALAPFTLKEWKFTIDNVKKLSAVLKEGDVEEFSYKIDKINPYDYLFACVTGTQKYLLKQGPDYKNNISQSNKR